MPQKKKRRQMWKQPYQRLLAEVIIILMISQAIQGDPHHIMQMLLHSLFSLR